MKRQDKLMFLEKLKEQPLTHSVIRPLLEAMGFKNITVTHGTREEGVDLLLYKENEFGEREYTGVQVKAVKIHKRVREGGNAAEILNQAQLAFTHKFPVISDRHKKTIDRFMVVTSRIAGYHDELPGFTRLEVMPFDQGQIKQFIENWFGKSDSSRAASMSKAVMENDNIRALAQNPLMIAIIAVIYEEDRELPQRRADLYKRAVEVLLSRWDVHKRLKNRFKPEKKEFILKKLAFLCHCRNHRTMPEKEILKEIKKYSSKIGLKKEEAKPFLEEIWQRSYLMRQIAMDTYDFLHLSFQEYFTALELKEQEDGIGTIIKHISEPWWEEPILLYAGISRDAESLIKRIDKEVKEDIFYSNLMLFGKCIADAEFTDEALKHDIAEKIWSIFEKPEFNLLKQKAKVVLRRLKSGHFIVRLIKQLTDKGNDGRWHAASALGEIGSDSALAPLIQALTIDKDNDVRMSAASALGSLGSNSALTPLIKALTQNKDKYVRRNAAEALGALGSDSALAPLIQALTQDKSSPVRWRAASALGKIGDHTTIQPLKKALEDKDYDVRDAAFEALEKVSKREGVRIVEAEKLGS